MQRLIGTMGACFCLLAIWGCSSPRESVRSAADEGRGTRQIGDLASRKRQAEQWDEAIELCRSRLAEAPDESLDAAKLHLELGRCLWERGREEDRTPAVEHARMAFQRLEDPSEREGVTLRPQAGRFLGSCLMSVGNESEAVRTFEALLNEQTEPNEIRIRTLHEYGNALYERATKSLKSSDYQNLLKRSSECQSEALAVAAILEQADANGGSVKRRPLPPDLPASIHNALGLVQLDLLLPLEAERSFREAGNILEKSNDPYQQAKVLRNVILSLIEQGKYEELKEARQRLEALPVAKFEPQVMASIGYAALELGEFDKALNQFDLAREIARHDARLGSNRPFLAEMFVNSAACLQEMGKFEGAGDYLADAERLVKKGSFDPRTSAVIRANRGRMYLTLENHRRAEEELEAVRATFRNLEGPHHPDTLRVIGDLANLARMRGHYVDAENLSREAIQGWTELRGDDHPDTALARSELTAVYVSQRKCGEAVGEARQVLAVLDSRLGTDHKRSVLAALRLAIIAADCADPNFPALRDNAESRFREFRQRSPGHLEVLKAQVHAADLASKDPKTHEWALERYREALEGFLARYHEGALSVAELRLKLGNLLEPMGDADGAFRAWEEGERELDPSLNRHPTRAKLLAALAGIASKRGDTPLATKLCIEAEGILKDVYGLGDPGVRETIGRCGLK